MAWLEKFLYVNITTVTKEKDHRDYIDEAQRLLRTFRGKAALNVINEGLEQFPSDPLLLSFNGFLIASIEKKYANGIRICENAIKKLDSSSRDKGSLYLNLGKAYVAANRKTEAVGAFKKGLDADPENRDIQWEFKKLGTRRKPALPFLKRSNPINKYLGRFLNRLERR
jgi:tetratricopeptide (TPR) repeat protein